MIDYSEKRDFIRMDMDCEMQIHCHKSGLQETVQLHDLSAAGMRFSSPCDLPTGSHVDVTIVPRNQLTPPLQAEVQIIRCDAQEGSQSYEVAAEITRVQPAEYSEAV